MAGLESSIAELPNMFLISTDLAMEPSDCLIYLAKQVIFLHFFLPKLYRLNLIDSLFFSFDLHDRKCTEGSLIKEIQRFIWEHCVLKPHIQELLQYVQYVLWWTALGVASSIGFGSGLHTFVLYLGPHIALFTIKAMQCGRVDLKSAPYDTIQLNHGPSWLDKDCSEFGPPLFESLNCLSVPLSSILPQVQLEAMLWGLGTALGELPPYFISRAASLVGSEVDPMEELGVPLAENSWSLNALFNRSKLWFISHAQYLNFLTALLLASATIQTVQMFLKHFFKEDMTMTWLSCFLTRSQQYHMVI